MISRKLIQEVPEARNHIVKNVTYQIVSLLNNVLIISMIGNLLHLLYEEELYIEEMTKTAAIIIFAVLVRFVCTIKATRESHLAAQMVKITLRSKIYRKMLRIGNRYTKKLSTAEVVQLAVEGVEQLETYFGSYLPQFFYAMIAPIILFIVVSIMNLKIAIILLIFVPLIPISIILVQKLAKKLLKKYWGEYTKLGDSFLENLQGISTLKIYSADEYKHSQMNEQAEQFRKITMRVLTMQLNSISVMDIIAYGGTASGVICSVLACGNGAITFAEAIVIILLCSEFFLPMRLLGSFFHIAMNGMAASKKMYMLLEMEVEEEKHVHINDTEIKICNLSYQYEEPIQDATGGIIKDSNASATEDAAGSATEIITGEIEILDDKVLSAVALEIKKNSLVSIVGESGCGKSTIAGIIAGVNRGYNGSVTIGGTELSEINQDNLLEHITMIGLGSYIFKGTVRDNLIMANSDATDQMLWEALDKVNLKLFLEEQEGLETVILERGANLSGGQCQRLAIARALLHNSSIYIFDEATSNIDAESENEIMKVVHELRETKTVILISHRLANVVESDDIYVLENGILVEQGKHRDLLEKQGKYLELWSAQAALEEVTESKQVHARNGGSYGKE